MEDMKLGYMVELKERGGWLTGTDGGEMRKVLMDDLKLAEVLAGKKFHVFMAVRVNMAEYKRNYAEGSYEEW